MKTIEINGKQLGIEDIYLDLSKLSEEERNFIDDLLKITGEITGHRYREKMSFSHIYLIKNSDVWWRYAYNFKQKTEITYSQFLELIGEQTVAENAQVEVVSKMENTAIVTDNSETLEHAKKLLQSNGYAVFPLDENGIPDLSNFKGVEMEVGVKMRKDLDGGIIYRPMKIIAKDKRHFISSESGFYDTIRPIQPELTDSEIVEKLGKDYLLNLIKENENEI